MSGLAYRSGREMPPGMQELVAVKLVEQMRAAAPDLGTTDGDLSRYAVTEADYLITDLQPSSPMTGGNDHEANC